VDVEFFAGPGHSEPADMAAIPHPRIGFVGNIAEWVDLDIIEGIALARRDWHIVMVGNYQLNRPRPEGGNIHWLGYRPYEDVPDYVASFDACIIPFQDSKLTRGADPLKLYEYLAAGKPVISTPIPRSIEFSDVVKIANGTDEFIAAIDASLSDENSSSEKRIAAARPHSWNGRYRTIVDMTKKHLAMELQ
jgi:glycosyltransferase involved in cell wall biosynthesis